MVSGALNKVRDFGDGDCRSRVHVCEACPSVNVEPGMGANVRLNMKALWKVRGTS